METLLKLLDSWNGPYAGHSERTSRYAVDIGTELELASRFLEFGEGVLNIILHHHERIIAVADSFDAMISERVYRKQPHDRKYAANQLIEGRGTQFDPVIVDIFLELLTSLEPPCNTNHSQSCKGGMNDV